MQIEIRYQPAYSLAIIRLEQNESIQAEAGAMVSMTANLEIDTSMKGGVLGALTRTVLGGETLFANTFTSKGGPGEITLAPARAKSPSPRRCRATSGRSRSGTRRC